MATKIRLKRMGKIRSPHYRIIVIDSRAKRDGKAIEEIGIYHPKNDPSVIQVDSERAQYWLGVGAQPTPAVVAILKATGDWQQFSGDKSPSGVKEQPARKDKLEIFNAALAEADDEPASDAISKRRGKAAEAAGDDAEAKDAKPAADKDAEGDQADAEAVEASAAKTPDSDAGDKGKNDNPASGEEQ